MLNTRKPPLTAALLFLYLYMGYIFLMLNQHFNIPLKIIPGLLICFGFIAYSRLSKSAHSWRYFYGSRATQLLLIFLLLLTGCFVFGTSSQLPKVGGFIVLVEIFISPMLLAVIALQIFPLDRQDHSEIKTIHLLCQACVAGVIFLAFTDVAHYLRDFYRIGRVPDDYSHRWFADGYIFFMPWLLLNFVKTHVLSRRLLWLAAIFGIFILISGTASRASLGVTVLEVCLFMAFYRKKPIAFLLPLFLVAAYFIGASILAPNQVEALLARGVTYETRVYDAWLPAKTFIFENPYFGKGFGLAIWNESFVNFLAGHSGWPGVNMGGTHNLILNVGFIGGIMGIACFVAFALTLIITLLHLVLRAPFVIGGPALATLCSFIDFYLVRGLVESPRFEPLGITVLFTLILSFAYRRSTLNMQKT